MLLDEKPTAWRWIFPLSASFGLITVCIQSKIPLKIQTMPQLPDVPSQSFSEKLTSPWKKAFDLLKYRPDFREFQWGFMIAGSALMLIRPALPTFFVDTLGITYTDLAIALSICKGLGFAAASPLWAMAMNRWHIHLISSSIFLSFCLFPILLIFSTNHIASLYTAYFAYGIAQAGSHLCWHLSGTIFADHHDHHDSSLYSTVNVLMVGIRGAIAPPIGSAFCMILGPLYAFYVGAILCGYSAIRMKKSHLLREKIYSPQTKYRLHTIKFFVS